MKMNSVSGICRSFRQLATVGLITVGTLSAWGQGEKSQLSPAEDSLAHFVRNIVTFNQMFSQEKVYLHFDNTGYFMGETIWFKAYVVNPMTNRPNILSRVLHVELVSPEGRVLQTQKLKIENGQGCGQFSLAELLHPGFYEVRAYTAVMLNWENAPYFSRVFPVFNPPQTEGKGMYDEPRMRQLSYTERLPGMREKAPKTEKLNVQFFPEGGNLVAGLPGRISFKATDKNGNPVKVEGKVVDGSGKTIVRMQSVHDGMGRFELTPEQGGKYYVEVDNGEKKVQRFALPEVLPAGYTMAVDNMADDSLRVHFACNENADMTQVLGVTVMSRGRVVMFDRVKWGNSRTATISLAKEKLPEGVGQVTLFDTQGRVYADRLVFKQPTHGVKFAVEGKKDIYRPKEKVEMTFKVTDTEGNPLRTLFSLAVRDADTETPQNQVNGGNIAANLLLGSEIRGYIHNIDYYFKADDQVHREALDLLLTTQGWRRYDWQQMTHPEDFEVKYPAEEGILLRGTLTSIYRNRIKEGSKIKVYLYNASGQSLVGSCVTDSLGQFAFLSEDFNGRWIMNIVTSDEDKPKEMNVNLLKMKSPIGRRFAEVETELFVASSEEMVSVSVADSVKKYDEEERKHWENLLPTVEVEATKEWQRGFVRRWNNVIYDMEDERMRIDETGEDYLKEFYVWLMETNPYFNFNYDDSGLIDATYKGRPVRFFITRVGSGARWLIDNGLSINVEDLSIHDIDAIAISDKPNSEQAMLAQGAIDSLTNDNSVFITVFVRQDYFRKKELKGYRKTKIQGFSTAYQFYVPDYSYADLPDEKDFRRTLYWEPYVLTNEQGEAVVTFYNSLMCRQMKVNAETITFGGLMGSFDY